METFQNTYYLIIAGLVLLAVVATIGVGLYRRRSARELEATLRESLPSTSGDSFADDVAAIGSAQPADAEPNAPPAPTLTIERPESLAGRMVRLRARLARGNAFGRGLLSLLSKDRIDEETWDEIEETLLLADIGADATDELMAVLRDRVRVMATHEPEQVRAMLSEELLRIIDPSLDRSIASDPVLNDAGETVPSVIMMVGVNGTGKTTTCGKLARVLVAQDKDVVLGAADTFRAAAAEQLATWGERVGVVTVRSDKDGADPASVAFDAVKTGVDEGADVVLVDTAGRLQNKAGLMDELSKVKRVATKALGGAEMQEVLLVLDATTGQNGLRQAAVFSEAVQITGIVLTKLDGTAKGGIVVAVQHTLGVPVKLVGLGEGVDDLAPFDPKEFVNALISG
ncbi:signal recognition particle-docking protein FtsY [Micrococcales bacterium 31B]|nr:signal recognition particle-docking protein FtsY [Micrococcales bacterium 31B]